MSDSKFIGKKKPDYHTQELYIEKIPGFCSFKKPVSAWSKEMTSKSNAYEEKNPTFHQRFANIGFTDPEAKQTHVFYVPTARLPKDKETEEDKQKREQENAITESIYAPHEIAWVDPNLTGSAHAEARKILEKNDPQYQALLLKYPQAENRILTGWSSRLGVGSIGRSTLNKSAFEVFELARYCSYFDDGDFERDPKTGLFERPEYTTDFHRMRTLGFPDYFKNLVNETRSQVETKKQLEAKKYSIADGKKYLEQWREKREEDEEDLADVLVKEIFIAAGLKENNPIELMKHYQTLNHVVIENALRVAKQYDININLNDDLEGVTPLMLAARNADSKSMEVLLKARANIEMKDNNGATALHYAILSGNIEVVEWLVESIKQDLNIKDQQGNGVLSYALRSENIKMVQWLKQHALEDAQYFSQLSDMIAKKLIDPWIKLIDEKSISQLPNTDEGHITRKVYEATRLGKKIDWEMIKNEVAKEKLFHLFEEKLTENKLDLNDCDLSPKHMPALVEFLKNHPEVTYLDLGNNRLLDLGVSYLNSIHSISTLNLSQNYIGSEGLKMLAQHPSITVLNLSRNQIGNEGIIALAKNPRLLQVNIEGNILISEKQVLEQALERNNKLVKESLETKKESISVFNETLVKQANELLANMLSEIKSKAGLSVAAELEKELRKSMQDPAGFIKKYKDGLVLNDKIEQIKKTLEKSPSDRNSNI